MASEGKTARNRRERGTWTVIGGDRKHDKQSKRMRALHAALEHHLPASTAITNEVLMHAARQCKHALECSNGTATPELVVLGCTGIDAAISRVFGSRLVLKSHQLGLTAFAMQSAPRSFGAMYPRESPSEKRATDDVRIENCGAGVDASLLQSAANALSSAASAERTYALRNALSTCQQQQWQAFAGIEPLGYAVSHEDDCYIRMRHKSSSKVYLAFKHSSPSWYDAEDVLPYFLLAVRCSRY